MSKLGVVATFSNQIHLQSKSQGGGDTNKEGCSPNAAVMAAFNVQYGVQLVQNPQQPKTPMLQSQQSASYLHIGITLHTRHCDYSFLIAHQHDCFYLQDLFSKTNQILTLLYTSNLPMFMYSIGRSLFKEKKSKALLVDVLWPG